MERGVKVGDGVVGVELLDVELEGSVSGCERWLAGRDTLALCGS